MKKETTKKKWQKPMIILFDNGRVESQTLPPPLCGFEKLKLADTTITMTQSKCTSFFTYISNGGGCVKFGIVAAKGAFLNTYNAKSTFSLGPCAGAVS